MEQEPEREPAWVARMSAIVGRRMARCEFANFEIGQDHWTNDRLGARDKVEQYARNLPENIQRGKNLVLMGPSGTGKDHLASAVVRHAVASGVNCLYCRGSVLCSTMRQHYMEHYQCVPQRFADADLLVISDIEPAKTGATDFEERALLELIDRRYLDQRPIVCTSNCISAGQLIERIGQRAGDRLLEGARLVVTTWPSYRKGVERA